MKKIGMLCLFLGLLPAVIAQNMEGITGEGKTKDGKKVGKWTYICDSTGEEIGVERYDGDGLKHGYQTWFTCEGVLIQEYNYSHGMKMGVQKEYYPVGKQLKREWSMVERSNKCAKTINDKYTTDPEYYKEWYETGRLKIEWEGGPCEERIITKYRPSNGTEWVVRYDDRGHWIDGPQLESSKYNGDDLR